jgi:hypothetical protein
VGEDVDVVATGVFQGIGKDGKARGVELTRRQGAFFVGGGGEADHGRGEEGRRKGDGAEEVAHDITEE